MVRKPATTFSNGTHGEGTGVAAAVTVGLTTAALGLMAAVAVTAASRVCASVVVLLTAVGLRTAVAGISGCCPLSVVGVAAVGATAVAARGVPVLAATGTSAFLPAVAAVGVPCALGADGGFGVVPWWLSGVEPAGSADALAPEGDGAAVLVGLAVDEPAVVAVAVVGLGRLDGPVGALPESAPAAMGSVPGTGFLLPGVSVCRRPATRDPPAALSPPSVAPLDDAEEFDPAPVPSSAAATPTPLTRAAPMPKATAPVPSHLYGSRAGRAACRARRSPI